MASFTDKKLSAVYKDILHTSNSNTGLSTTIKQITCGDGDSSGLYLSSQNLKAQPASDSTTNTAIYDADGNALFTVNSTDDLVKAGIGQHTVNTQYARFATSYVDVATSGFAAGYHYAIPFGLGDYGDVAAANYILGNGADPATSLTIEDTAMGYIRAYWYVIDNITLDAIHWFVGADAATGDTVRCHLMAYDVVTTAGGTSGDLSNGAIHASGADIVATSARDAIYYQTVTPSTANVDAGKIILFTFEADSVNSDYTINATVKYHLR